MRRSAAAAVVMSAAKNRYAIAPVWPPTDRADDDDPCTLYLQHRDAAAPTPSCHPLQAHGAFEFEIKVTGVISKERSVA